LVIERRPFVIERLPFVTTERLFVIAHRRFVIADLIRNPVPADTGCRVEPGMTSWRSGMTSWRSGMTSWRSSMTSGGTACGLAMTGIREIMRTH
jgi:hypothetical protein